MVTTQGTKLDGALVFKPRKLDLVYSKPFLRKLGERIIIKDQSISLFSCIEIVQKKIDESQPWDSPLSVPHPSVFSHMV